MPLTAEQEYQRTYHTTRAERLKAEGRCYNCRGPLNGSTRVNCDNCRAVFKAKLKARRLAFKVEVLGFYSKQSEPECVCCGERILDFLSLDHIDGKGAEHRRQDTGSINIYFWAFRNNFPEGFQTMCHNCNRGKFLNGGVCPHVNMKQSAIL